MREYIVEHVTVFLTVFAILSLFKLLIDFIRALVSNPPKRIELSTSALIYYGVCLSYVITTLILK